jgi:hypothetical protein
MHRRFPREVVANPFGSEENTLRNTAQEWSVLQEKPVPVPIPPLQIPQRLEWD